MLSRFSPMMLDAIFQRYATPDAIFAISLCRFRLMIRCRRCHALRFRLMPLCFPDICRYAMLLLFFFSLRRLMPCHDAITSCHAIMPLLMFHYYVDTPLRQRFDADAS